MLLERLSEKAKGDFLDKTIPGYFRHGVQLKQGDRMVNLLTITGRKKDEGAILKSIKAVAFAHAQSTFSNSLPSFLQNSGPT